MTKPAATPRARLRAVAAAILGVFGALACAAPAHASDPLTTVLDRTNFEPVDVPAATERAQDRLRQRLGDAALLETDPMTGTPRIVARLDGFLTPPSSKDPETIALDYVRDHAGAFGVDADDLAELRLTDREQGPDGTVHLSWEQRAGGLPNVDGGLQAAVTAEGRLLNVRGGVVPDLDAESPEPLVSAAAAYATVIPGAAPPPSASTPTGPDRETIFVGGGTASLVRYQDDGAERLGWRLLAPGGPDAFYKAIVDARTGTLQRRANLVRSASAINHFNVNPQEESGTPTPSVVPADWLASDADSLNGHYVHAVADLDDSIPESVAGPPYVLPQPGPGDEIGPGSVNVDGESQWDFPHFLGMNPAPNDFCTPLCSWKGTNRTANLGFSTAQLFWYVNTFREHLARAPIGFTAARDGFEGGTDQVLAQSHDGADFVDDADHRNNASMLTLPDGQGALMEVRLFRFNPGDGTKRYDGSHDAGLVYHEYTHALTDRLIADPQGLGAMDGAQPGALAEGISDFYALDFLAETQPTEVPDTSTPGEVRFGGWLGGLRTQGVDCGVGDPGSACPGTGTAGTGGYDYGDFGRVDTGFPAEVHDNGEIWAQTLWSLRTALTAAHGEQDGLLRARTYVTNGLRFAPDNPTFLDMRNAIVQASVDANLYEDWTTIWEVFAARGMGWSATTDGADDLTPSPSHPNDPDDVPSPPGDSMRRGSATGIVRDEAGSPIADARIAAAGYDSGLWAAIDIGSTTGADGGFTLASVPAGSYSDVYAAKPGYREATTQLVVAGGTTTTIDFGPLRRDYASAVWGGSATTPRHDFSGIGCGPTQGIDDDRGTVWSTPANAGQQDLVIDLGQQIDLDEVRIDPRAGCGDGPEASLHRYELAASDGPGQPFEQIAAGEIGAAGTGRYVPLPVAGDLAGRRLLRLRAIAPRSLDQGGVGPFMDVSELEVTGVPVPVPPPPPPPPPPPTPTPEPTAVPTVTPTPTPTPPAPAPRVTVLIDTSLKATRKGLFKVRAFFGDAAPAGNARFTVLNSKRKRLARATTPVLAGRNVVKTLRLTRTGRRTIKPGRSKRITLELRLPSGEKYKKTLKLTRSKR